MRKKICILIDNLLTERVFVNHLMIFAYRNNPNIKNFNIILVVLLTGFNRTFNQNLDRNAVFYFMAKRQTLTTHVMLQHDILRPLLMAVRPLCDHLLRTRTKCS
jgi:hypothetical protein